MPNTTIEAALKERLENPDKRALVGTILMKDGNPTITFGAVGKNRRFSVRVVGDDLKVVDDPRTQKKSEPAPAKVAQTTPKPDLKSGETK